MELLSEVQGGPLPATVPSLWEHFAASVKKYPDNLALICTHQEPSLYGISSTPLEDGQYHQNPYLRWTYRNLKLAVDRLANGLKNNGVKTGTRVFTFMPNMAEYVITLWAVYRLGALLVPINPRNLLNQEETVHMIHTALKGDSFSSTIVIAANTEVAQKFDNLAIKLNYQLVVCGSDDLKGDWQKFSDLTPPTANTPKDDELFQSTEDTIFFTSGTTSLPKGCQWKYPALSMAIEQRKALGLAGVDDVICTIIPNNHGIGWYWMTMTVAVGATLVFPGPTFVPHVFMDVMRREGCTIAPLVPTMVHALTSIMTAGGSKLKSLKSVFLGGSLVSPEVLKECVEGLGSKGVENGWGMTEGAILCSGNHADPSELIHNGEVTIGKPMAGSKVRICAPGTKRILTRGEIGEMHFAGPQLRDGYISQDSQDFYIGDDGCTWLNTGDQANINRDGWVTIMGRYKEMIIRGGENISPAAIEFTLGKVPKLAACNIQVVGAEDAIAGEVLVAIIQGDSNPDIVQELQKAALSKLGPAFVPDEVLSLKALGLDEYPRTMSGKIQKAKLAKIVATYRGARESALPNGYDGPKRLEDSIRRIWSRAVGYDVDDDTPISDFADSITVMRVRDRIFKETGSSISLSDMVDAVNIAGQIRIIERQGQHTGKRPTRKYRPGPPGMEDLVHIGNDPDRFKQTKAYIEAELVPHNLSWEDVEDVVPAYDFGKTLSWTGIFESWNFMFAFLSKGMNSMQVREALEKTLSNNRIMASFLLWNKTHLSNDTVLHVLVRHGEKFFEQIIFDHGKVKTLEELKQLPLKNPFQARATVPGPLFRAFIVEVEELKCAAVVIDVHHAIVDASYGLLFFEDFDQALGGTTLVEHVDYKTWANSYYALRTSFDAKVATDWHVDRLKNLHEHAKALFPPNGLGPIQTEEDGFRYSFSAPGIPALREKYGHITAPVVLKAANVLLNIHYTGHTHALFANLEAARTRFPFVPKALEYLDGQGYEASDVAGPTIQMVTNLVQYKPDEMVLELLERMQDDQNNLTKYASAPLGEIISSLGDAGPMVLESLKAQIFNWVPGMGSTGSNPYSHFEMVGAVVRPEIRLAINAGMGGSASDTVFLHLRSGVLRTEQLPRIARDMSKITLWLTENLDSAVAGFRENLEMVNGTK